MPIHPRYLQIANDITDSFSFLSGQAREQGRANAMFASRVAAMVIARNVEAVSDVWQTSAAQAARAAKSWAVGVNTVLEFNDGLVDAARNAATELLTRGKEQAERTFDRVRAQGVTSLSSGVEPRTSPVGDLATASRLMSETVLGLLAFSYPREGGVRTSAANSAEEMRRVA